MIMTCCRTCLSETDLNKIFVSTNKTTKCSKVLLKATGLKILTKDGLSQSMCATCIKFVNEYLAFRKTCKKSYLILLSQKRIKKEVSDTSQNNGNLADASNKTSKFKARDFTYNNSLMRNPMAQNEESLTDHNKFCYTSINNTSKDEDTFETNAENHNSNTNDYKYNPERHKSAIENSYTEFEATIEEILNRPRDVLFENKTLNKSIQLDYQKVRKQTKVEVQKEILKSEMKEEPLECKYCHKLVKSKCALNNHYKIHTGRNIVCEHCGKKFTSKRRLLIHCRGRHGYKKTDKCQYCEYRGSSLEMVKIHERLHTGERPFVCAQCGAGFHRRSSYLQHVAIHRQEKTVPCDECPALFKSVTLMKIHKNRHKTRRKKQIALSTDHLSL